MVTCTGCMRDFRDDAAIAKHERDVATRRWRLTVHNRQGEVIHTEVCIGDRSLSGSLAIVEARPDFGRAAVKAWVYGDRPTITADVVETGVAAHVRCDVCELTEPECRRRSAINGHEFTDPNAIAEAPATTPDRTL